MYEELVKDLRENHDKYFARDMQAADAIGQLVKDLERSKDFESFWQQEAEEALRRYQVVIANKPQWIPVTERLPEPFESVLVCYQREGRYGTSCGHYYIDRGTTIWKASGIIPTHWMPLQDPPKEE